MPILRNFGAWKMTPQDLIALRLAYKLTQVGASRLTGVAPRTWQNWEQGISPIPPMAAKCLPWVLSAQLGDKQNAADPVKKRWRLAIVSPAGIIWDDYATRAGAEEGGHIALANFQQKLIHNWIDEESRTAYFASADRPVNPFSLLPPK
jgi:hypothetical protein